MRSSVQQLKLDLKWTMVLNKAATLQQSSQEEKRKRKESRSKTPCKSEQLTCFKLSGKFFDLSVTSNIVDGSFLLQFMGHIKLLSTGKKYYLRPGKKQNTLHYVLCKTLKFKVDALWFSFSHDCVVRTAGVCVIKRPTTVI